MGAFRFSSAAIFGAVASIAAGSAFSSTPSLPLNYQTTVTGTATETSTPTAASGAYYYGDSFANGSGSTAIGATNVGFYDDFIFSVTGGTADAVTTDINLGSILSIDNLQAALFNFSGGTSVPVAGTPLATGWSQTFDAGGGTTVNYVALPAIVLPDGTYALEIRGLVTGSQGGSYSGTLNVSPVPAAASFPLFLMGLGGVGFWARRRRQ